MSGKDTKILFYVVFDKMKSVNVTYILTTVTHILTIVMHAWFNLTHILTIVTQIVTHIFDITTHILNIVTHILASPFSNTFPHSELNLCFDSNKLIHIAPKPLVICF
jgi:phage-related protein